MTRTACLTTLAAVGVLVAVAANEARQDRFRIRPLEVADNLHVLTSDPAEQGMRTGGNTAVFVTESGVVLVDTKIRGYGEDILAEVRRITDRPVTTIINTHTHWDHSGANTEFPDTVDFVTHENTAAHMASADCDDGAGFEGGSIKNCEAFAGDNRRYLPDTTFGSRMSLFRGPDRIDLYHFGRGHTDGDTFVVFRAVRAMHTGDLMARKGLPFVDADNTNGSATEFGATLQKAVDEIENVDTIIPGHADDPLRGPVARWGGVARGVPDTRPAVSPRRGSGLARPHGRVGSLRWHEPLQGTFLRRRLLARRHLPVGSRPL